MTTGRLWQVTALVGALVGLLPAATWAQSGIAGVVTDNTGAVMPGVTVEASSPALIEGSRIGITDGQGRYNIVDLRPGAYVVTFTLTGFSTVRREGIELPASFTATVNAELRVGALEETITVSGQAPAVDVQSSIQRQVLRDEVLEAVPILRGPQMFAAVQPQVVNVKLGANGRISRPMSVHNSRSGESVVAIDGFGTQMMLGPGSNSDVFYMSQANIEELSVELGGGSAERQTGGTFTNVIPKEGGNRFSGFVFGSYSNEHLQGDNLSDEQKAQGASVQKTIEQWDVNPAFGGPILREKLWFYLTARHSAFIEQVPGAYYDTDPLDWIYTPDLSRPPGVSDIYDPNISTRLTWQVTPKNKVTIFYEINQRLLKHRNLDSQAGTLTAPEASTIATYFPNDVAQVVWKSPVTSRLLLEFGSHQAAVDWNPRYRSDALKENRIGAYDELLQVAFRAPITTDIGHHISHAFTQRASATYVTGSHAFKAGLQFRNGSYRDTQETTGSMTVRLINGNPRSIVLYATPFEYQSNLKDLGVFAQDAWTHRRLTLNLGIRYDYFNGSTTAEEAPAGRFVPARSFEPAKDVPNWHDLSPRLGVAYDLFGDSRTALKATLNRYVAGSSTSTTSQNQPVTRSVTSATRTWADGNRDYIPDCDFSNPAVNGECGRLSNLNFGQVNPSATRYDPDILRGFGKRGYNWETSLVVERELASGISMNVGYFRRWYGNFTTTENLAVGPGDYETFCITAPVDPRLPGGGGNQICGLYDITPTKFGASENFGTFAKNFQGTRREVYDGVDVTGQVRFAGGGYLSGGLSTGRTKVSDCLVVDSPEEARFCDVSPPFLTNVKFLLAYPLPWWGLETGAVLQSVPGPQILANYVARSSEIRPSLGRDLASGPNGTRSVALIAPGTVYGDRGTMVDLRVGRVFNVGRSRINVDIDLLNLLNVSPVRAYTLGYGPNWLFPRDILYPRGLQFSARASF